MPSESHKFKPEVLLSVNIPKTGGTSLREVLLARFGSNLYLDYSYVTNRSNSEADIRAIHGAMEAKIGNASH